MSELRVVPITLRKANDFVEQHHRHMARYPGHDPDDEDAANRELIAAAVNYVRQRLAEQEPKP